MSQRVIKFRTWNPVAKQMFYGFGQFIFHGANGLEAKVMWKGRDVDQVIMQFTGLLDKNGKEIYEGDILRDEEGLCVAIWDGNGSWGVSLVEEDGRYSGSEALLSEWHASVEVIGNIHEHPELLEVSA